MYTRNISMRTHLSPRIPRGTPRPPILEIPSLPERQALLPYKQCPISSSPLSCYIMHIPWQSWTIVAASRALVSSLKDTRQYRLWLTGRVHGLPSCGRLARIWEQLSIFGNHEKIQNDIGYSWFVSASHWLKSFRTIWKKSLPWSMDPRSRGLEVSIFCKQPKAWHGRICRDKNQQTVYN